MPKQVFFLANQCLCKSKDILAIENINQIKTHRLSSSWLTNGIWTNFRTKCNKVLSTRNYVRQILFINLSVKIFSGIIHHLSGLTWVGLYDVPDMASTYYASQQHRWNIVKGFWNKDNKLNSKRLDLFWGQKSDRGFPVKCHLCVSLNDNKTISSVRDCRKKPG